MIIVHKLHSQMLQFRATKKKIIILHIESTLSKKINLISVCQFGTSFPWKATKQTANANRILFFFFLKTNIPFFYLHPFKNWMNCFLLLLLLALIIESKLTNYLKTNAALLIKISWVNGIDVHVGLSMSIIITFQCEYRRICHLINRICRQLKKKWK